MKASRGFARRTFYSSFLTCAFFMRTSPLLDRKVTLHDIKIHLHSIHLSFFRFIRSLTQLRLIQYRSSQNLLVCQMFIRSPSRFRVAVLSERMKKDAPSLLFSFSIFFFHLPSPLSYFPRLVSNVSKALILIDENQKFCFAPRRRNKFHSVNSLLFDRPLFVVAFHSPRTIYRWPLNHFPANN